jgi:hypothetical protein
LQIKLTPTFLTEILLKVALNTITLTLTLQKCIYIYTPTKVKHHPIFLSIYFFTSILLKQ